MPAAVNYKARLWATAALMGAVGVSTTACTATPLASTPPPSQATSRPQPSPETETIRPDPTADRAGWATVRRLIDASSSQSQSFTEQAVALIEAAEWSPTRDQLNLTIDRVELTEGSAEDGLYINEAVQLEELTVQFPLILVDPHNGFYAVDPGQFATTIDTFEDNPFYLYSLGDETVALVQFMLA